MDDDQDGHRGGADGTGDGGTERSQAVEALVDLLLSTPALEEFVDGVVQVAAERIAPATAASLTLQRDGRSASVASSDARAALCDEVETATEDGPCPDSIREGRTLLVKDIATERRWTQWRRAALDQGFSSAAAVPRNVRPGVGFALNLYAPRPHAWDAAAMARAQTYADEIARALTLALRTADLTETNADLQAALASRAVIDQAIGVVMAQNRCTSEQAFAILRGASQNRNVRLRDLAATLVAGVSGAEPAPGTPFVARTAARNGDGTHTTGAAPA